MKRAKRWDLPVGNARHGVVAFGEYAGQKARKEIVRRLRAAGCSEAGLARGVEEIERGLMEQVMQEMIEDMAQEGVREAIQGVSLSDQEREDLIHDLAQTMVQYVMREGPMSEQGWAVILQKMEQVKAWIVDRI